MAEFYKMTDGAHHIVVSEDKRELFEGKGFRVESDHVPEPGHLVGHIRYRPPVPPKGNGLPYRRVEVTDGHQIILVDANHEVQWDVYIRKGFLELPAMPEKPDLTTVDDPQEIAVLMQEWVSASEPIRQAREAIKQRALDLEDGRAQQ